MSIGPQLSSVSTALSDLTRRVSDLAESVPQREDGAVLERTLQDIAVGGHRFAPQPDRLPFDCADKCRQILVDDDLDRCFVLREIRLWTHIVRAHQPVDIERHGVRRC